jgi:hypothetical protein
LNSLMFKSISKFKPFLQQTAKNWFIQYKIKGAVEKFLNICWILSLPRSIQTTTLKPNSCLVSQSLLILQKELFCETVNIKKLHLSLQETYLRFSFPLFYNIHVNIVCSQVFRKHPLAFTF